MWQTNFIRYAWVWLACLPVAVLAQTKPSIKPTTDFDQRFSFIKNKGVNIWGYRIGVLVNDKYKAGIGGYFVRQDSLQIFTNSPDVFQQKIQRDIYFGTLFYEPFVFRKSWVQMSVLFELGYGTVNIDSALQRVNGVRTIQSKREPIIPAAVGVSYYFKLPNRNDKARFLNYFGINVMAGLRAVILANPSPSDYSGFYWSVGGTVFLEEVYSDFKRKRALRLANNNSSALHKAP